MRWQLSIVLFLYATGTFAQRVDSFSRLVAMATIGTYQGGVCPDYYYYMAGDSIVYSYSGMRMGDLNHTMQFDISRTYHYDTASHKFLNTCQDSTLQRFDANDSILSKYINNSIQWIYAYNSHGKELSNTEFFKDYRTGQLTNYHRVTSEYDEYGNLIQKIEQHGDPTNNYSWVNSSRIINQYDANNKLVSSTSQTGKYPGEEWLNTSQAEYSYSSGYKMEENVCSNWDTVTGDWNIFNRRTTLLNADSLDSFSRMQYWDNTTRDYSDKGTASHWSYQDKRFQKRTDTSHIIWDWSVNSWKVTVADSYAYDAAGHVIRHLTDQDQTTYSDFRLDLPQTVVYNHHGNIQVTHYSYNSFGQVTRMICGMDTVRYYYETVKTTTQDTLQPPHDSIVHSNYILKLYPIPAAYDLNIALQWDTARPFIITISDISGRIVTSWDETPTSNYKKVISVAELPAGHYFLRVNYDGGIIKRRFCLARYSR